MFVQEVLEGLHVERGARSGQHQAASDLATLLPCGAGL